MTTPPDPDLPQRLAAAAIVRDGEQRIGRTWFRSMTRFLDRVRPAVFRGAQIDPSAVASEQQFWTNEVDVAIVPEIRGVLTDAWQRINRRDSPGSDIWVSAYLNEAGNRLVNVPDEVYGLIVAEVERGIREGDGIVEVTANIQLLLTASGTDRWPNRARVVARTETMGAVNAGVFRAAQLDAQRRGDPAPFKVWLSTDDTRTRPTHRAADRQRTLLSEPFKVGGAQLMFPGDPRGPAQEVIQCRCSLLPIILGETLDWTDRQNARGDA